jgi:putative transposase
MMYDPNKHHRRSIRLKGYDYARPGAYFVTICVRERECALGGVVDGEMVLNDWGRIVAESWSWLAEQYPYITLDEWVVMPNHLHGIIIINDDAGRGASRRAPTAMVPAKRKPLGQLVGAFKTVSTKRINQMRDTASTPFWQRGFYEHIVRNDRELDAIRQYIIYNPLKWELDRDNPDNTEGQTPCRPHLLPIQP